MCNLKHSASAVISTAGVRLTSGKPPVTPSFAKVRRGARDQMVNNGITSIHVNGLTPFLNE